MSRRFAIRERCLAAVRTFNTEGPVVAADHYQIPPLERIDLDAVLGLVGDKKYFVLHAPRQTGKTSALLALRDLLNGGHAGDYRCVYANVEAGQAARWVQRFERYHEAGPQLLLQAHLQRIVNGGGRIEREYALGRGRTDLLIVWPQGGRERRFVVECKVRRGELERTVADGMQQTRAYVDRCGAEAGHLIVFDRAPERSWEEKIFRRAPSADGVPVTVWGM